MQGSGDTATTDISLSFKGLWDDQYLYILAAVTDDDLQNDGGADYHNDNVEIYLDMDNSKSNSYDANDHQVQYLWNNTLSVSGVTAAQINTTDGYNMEFRFNWSTLGLP